jgi:perosamine synthetase
MGGSPLTLSIAAPPRPISVCTPLLDGREREYLQNCLDGNWISSLGEFIPRFETAFAELCDAPFAVSCSSGTAALHLALEALEIRRGDEVIIPAFTLIVSANMVCLTGATPVLVDVRPDTWCIDSDLIESKITPRTRAIMAVHMYGHPCDMEPILAIARKHNLFVIEDAAEAHGARYHGRPVGALGDVGVFSFYANKTITTGEGGMLVTRDPVVAERAALLRNQAFEAERFVHRDVGFNYRLTNLQAAIGLAQCERFEEKVRRKIERARVYDELLGDAPGIQTPVQAPGCRNVYWMYGIVLNAEFGPDRNRVREELARAGIETRPFFVPMHLQPVFQGSDRRWPDLRGDYPVSERLGARGLYLPSGLDLTRAEQEYIVERLLSCRH